MSINRIVCVGRLTKSPDLRSTPQGNAVATFTIAVDRSFGKDKETDFIPVVVWKSLAENCAKNLDKGKLVAVDGRLQIRTFEDSKGEKKTIAEIVANDVQFLSPKSAPAEPRYEEPMAEMPPMDEIPF